MSRQYPRNRWVFGAFKRDCDVCGFQWLSIELKKQWDGVWACPRCYDPRHIATMGVKHPVEMGDRLF